MNAPQGAAAGIYVRISSDPEGRRVGVERQLKECRALIQREGLAEVEVYEDNDASAYSGKPRPKYRKLLHDLEDGTVKVVVAWDPDRLHRSPKELEEFIDVVEKVHAEVVTVNGGEVDLSTSQGRLVARIRGDVARHESEHKSDRHKSAEIDLAIHGKAHGGRRPFGFEPDRVTIRAEEAELIRQATKRVLAGESVYSLAQDWRTQDVPTPAGNAWTSSALRKLLMSGRIAGRREHNGVDVAKAEWDPIISVEDHEKLRARLPHPNLRGKGMGNKPYRYILSGIARCGRCGSRLVARPGTRRNKAGEKVRAMICPKDSPDKNLCGGIRIVAQPMEDFVTSHLIEQIDGGALSRLLAGGQQHRLVDVQSELADVDQRLVIVAEEFSKSALSPAAWRTANENLNRRRAELKADLEAIMGDTTLAEIPSPLDREIFESRPFDWRRQVIRAFIEKVVVGPQLPRKGRLPGFDPRRVEIIWKV